MSTSLETFLADLDQIGKLAPAERTACRERTDWLRTATAGEVRQWLAALQTRRPPAAAEEAALLEAALGQFVGRQHGPPGGRPGAELDADAAQAIAQLYRHWGRDCQARTPLLAWLAACHGRSALTTLVELLAEDPPRDERVVAAILSPLFQRKGYDPDVLFPRLLDGLVHASAAAAIMDLANFVTRKRLVPVHPATDHLASLVTLLGGVVGRLGRLESDPESEQGTPEEISRQVNEGVTLAVSLCDALALIGDRSVVGKLYQAMELGHRRLCTEAAAALARLGEQAGVETLVALAAEPVARLRVLAYAEELGVLDQVAEPYRSDQAQAESELVLWLAQPAQMGIPPTRCELIDSRCQAWPGYDEPVDCWLFRFTYQFADHAFSNIGIVGPVVHAGSADLSDLPPDDIYALFAGWQAEHAEIFERDVEDLSAEHRTKVFRLERRLRDEGYDAIQPLRLGSFFGDRVLVARATRQGGAGVAVVDAVQTFWLPRASNHRPPGPDEAYWIYKGRRLLRTFNP